MHATWKRGIALAVVTAISTIVVADVEGQILRRRRAWRRNVVTTNYFPAATTGVRTTSFYAPTDNLGATTAAAADLSGSGLTYARAPTYRRGLFGRRIYTGTQLRTVQTAQTTAAADIDSGIDRNARGFDARAGARLDTNAPGARARVGADADINAPTTNRGNARDANTPPALPQPRSNDD